MDLNERKLDYYTIHKPRAMGKPTELCGQLQGHFFQMNLTILNQGEACEARSRQCTLPMKLSNTPSSQGLGIIWVGPTKTRQPVL